MSDFLVPKGIAVRLREIGYDRKCHMGLDAFDRPIAKFSQSYEGSYIDWDRYDKDLPLPTFEEAIEWFGDVHGLFANPVTDQTMEPKFGYEIAIYIKDGDTFDWGDTILSPYLYYTRREAKIACIQHMIRLVANEKVQD
jgi:hypothetical protein